LHTERRYPIYLGYADDEDEFFPQPPLGYSTYEGTVTLVYTSARK